MLRSGGPRVPEHLTRLGAAGQPARPGPKSNFLSPLSCMLRFQSPPDPVFTAILHDALEEMHNRLINLQDADDAADAWRASYPSASKVFSLPLATETIERLREASVPSLK